MNNNLDIIEVYLLINESSELKESNVLSFY